MAASYTFDGLVVQTSLNTDTIITDAAQTGSNNPGTDLDIQPGAGDGSGKGGTINLTGGTGGSTGDGGDIILDAGQSAGTGTQGTITFSALDNTAPLPFNETGDTDLSSAFTAASIVGALNELKDGVIPDDVNQGEYNSLVDLDYNGSTIVDIPTATTTVTTGDWLVGFNVVFTTSTPTEPVPVFIRDGSNTIISQSKTFIADASNNSRHTVSKQFVYTEALASNTLKISYQLNSGAATTVAVEMTAMTNSATTADQVPVIWATEITTAFDQNTYTTITDLNYNGTTEVDVPGTITLTAGDWLIGYSLTLRVPSSPDTILAYVQDASNVIVDASRTHLADNTTTTRHTVTKAFIFTATATSYRLTFRLDSTATTSVAVEMSALSGVTNPDQVPVLWAYRLDALTNDQNLYTTLTDLNYNGTTTVDVPGTISLTSGTWLLGYSLALTAPSAADSSLVHIRTSPDNVILGNSKTFVTENSTTSIHTVSRAFVFSILTAQTLKLSFVLNDTSATNVAVDMTSLALSPAQAPVLWALRVADASNSNTFLGLNDTPSSYVGQSGKIVTVAPSETALQFSTPITDTITGPFISIISVNSNVTGSPAVSGVVVEKTSIIRVNDEILLTAVFSVDTIAAGNTEFTFSLPDAQTLTNIFDVTAPVSAWVDSSPPVSITDAFCIGVAASTNAFAKFTAANGTDTHYFSVNARYTQS